MPDNKDQFAVTELEDIDLEKVAGGMADTELVGGVDIACTDNKDCPNNSGNCVSGCSCT